MEKESGGNTNSHIPACRYLSAASKPCMSPIAATTSGRGLWSISDNHSSKSTEFRYAPSTARSRCVTRILGTYRLGIPTYINGGMSKKAEEFAWESVRDGDRSKAAAIS